MEQGAKIQINRTDGAAFMEVGTQDYSLRSATVPSNQELPEANNDIQLFDIRIFERQRCKNTI